LCSCLPLNGCKILDVEAAASNGGPGGRLYGERHHGGGALVSWSFGWQGSRSREFLELTVLRQGLLPDRVLRAGFEDSGRSKISGVYEGFYGQKLSASMPTMATPVGVVTLLRAPLWLPLLC
jgi:hypothetical protein